METIFVGLDVSKDETAICVRTSSATIVSSFKVAMDPQAIQDSHFSFSVVQCCHHFFGGHMGKPYPIEFRERVIAFVEADNTHRTSASRFQVSIKFVNDMVRLKQESGSLQAKRQGNPVAVN